MTYTQLTADVAAYLHRTGDASFTAQIPGFIEKARLRIMRDLRPQETEFANLVVTLTNGSGTLPANVSEVRSVTGSLGSGTFQLRLVPSTELPLWTSGQTPGVYALTGRNIVAPGLSSVTVAYFAIEAAVTGASESVTMAAFPQLWLSASVMEGAFFIQDLETASAFATMYADEVALQNTKANWLRYGVAPSIISTDYNPIAGPPVI